MSVIVIIQVPFTSIHI